MPIPLKWSVGQTISGSDFNNSRLWKGPDYIIFKDGTLYYRWAQQSDLVDASGSDINSIIATAISTLSSGLIYVKDFNIGGYTGSYNANVTVIYETSGSIQTHGNVYISGSTIITGSLLVTGSVEFPQTPGILKSGSWYGGNDFPSYIIWSGSNLYWAKNCSTNKIENSGSNATTIIQGAINSLPTSGGKILFKGTKRIPIGKITLRDRLTLEGEVTGAGEAGTELFLSGSTNDDMFSGSFGSTIHYITLKNLVLNGNRGNQTKGNLLYISNCFRVFIENCYFIYAKESGIYLSQGEDCTIEKSMFDSCTVNGIFMVSGGQNVITDCELGLSGVENLKLYNTRQNVISKNYMHSAIDAALRMQGSLYNIVMGNIFSQNQITGSGNYAAIYLDNYLGTTGSTDNIFLGNIANDAQDTPTQLRFIEETGNSGYNVIVGNNVRDCPNGLGVTVSTDIISKNIGYINEGKGTLTLSAQSGSTAHGLSSTATKVNLTASGSSASLYLGALSWYPSGSTGIWVVQTGSGTVAVNWSAEV